MAIDGLIEDGFHWFWPFHILGRIPKEVDPESEDESEIFEVKVPELDKSDDKCFEIVEKIIQGYFYFVFILFWFRR